MMIRHQRSSICLNDNRSRKHSISIGQQSKSPTRNVNGIKLYNFSDIDSYRKIHRPLLTEEKKKSIKQKLDLEKKALDRVIVRTKRRQNFVPFEYNPFTVKAKLHSKSLFNLDYEEQKEDKAKDIVTELHNMKQKRLDQRQHSASLIKLKDEAVGVRKLINKQLKNNSKSMVTIKKPSLVSLVENEPVVQSKKLFASIFSFEEIIDLQEEKFDPNKNKDLNIFKILYDKQYYFGHGIPLDRHYFSFASVIEKNANFKVQIYRDVSREARKMIRRKPEGIYKIHEDYFFKQISFEDMLHVAQGRHTPQFINLKLNKQKHSYEAVAEKTGEVPLPDHLRSKRTNAAEHTQAIAEIGEYMNLQLSKEEIRYQRLCENRKNSINKLLKRERQLVKEQITDKKLHTEIKDIVYQKMSDFVDAQHHKCHGERQMNRKIAHNKEVKKQRYEAIKVQKLIQTYLLKKDNKKQLDHILLQRA